MPYQTPTHRHLCSELVSLVCAKNGRTTTLSGNLEEIGEWSALVLAETPIARRTKVRIACEGHDLKGFVRSCRHEKSLGFLVDVRLYQESRWSEQWFTPKHLLALCGNLQSKAFHARVA
jgi:hypothetical protein